MEKYRLNPEALQIKTNYTRSQNLYQVEGSEITWVEVNDKTNTNFRSNSNNHLWTNLGIYSEADIIKFGVTRSEGGYSDTAISDIYEAYNQGGMLVADVSPSAFRATLQPNMKITLPINGGTGSLNGLTSVDLYTVFFEQNDSKKSDGSGACATWMVDCLWNESHPESTYQAGIGYSYNPPNNPGVNTDGKYRSGIMYLFSEDIYFSGNTGTTFSQGWSGNTRYTFGDSPLAKFDGDERNRAVGMINLDSGVMSIFNPDIVSAFDTSVATGGTITSGLTFNTSDCGIIAGDRDVSTSLQINTVLEPQTFTKSMNPSLLDAKQNGLSCDGQVAITKVCYYDDNDNLVATGLLSTPIIKRTEDYTLLKAEVTLDGGTLEGENSPENDGRNTFS